MGLKGQMGTSLGGNIVYTRKLNPYTVNCRNCKNCKQIKMKDGITKKPWCRAFNFYIGDTSNAKVCKEFQKRNSTYKKRKNKVTKTKRTKSVK